MNITLLSKIANQQILQAGFNNDLGLFNGKSGTMLFFFYYGRFHEKELYQEFTNELMEEIYEDIRPETPIHFHNGLSGIGWTLEYLLQEGYVEGDSDEILSDLDREIMKPDPLRFTDFSLRSGLEGIAWYVLSRLTSPRPTGMPFDDKYLNDIKLACSNTRLRNTPEGMQALYSYLQHGELKYSLNEVLQKIILSSEKEANTPLSWQKGIKLLMK